MMKVLSAIWHSPWFWTINLMLNLWRLLNPNQSAFSVALGCLLVAVCVLAIVEESIRKFYKRMFDSEDES
jgi:hypothetical protein